MGYTVSPGATSDTSKGGGYDTTDETSLTTYNNLAAASAAAAATSATSATASATSATASATSATASANTATTQATNASNSATSAGTSASTATTQAGIATTQATNASTSAATATTQAGIATTQATNASNSATASASSATAAATARDQALAAFDNFDDKYLGEKTTNPTVDNDGNALQTGALYFNSVDDIMKVYTGTVWTAAYVSGTGFLATSNNLSDLQSAPTARTNLGLGTLSTQDSNSVAITSGSINGTTVGATTPATGAFTTLSATGVTTVQAGSTAAPAITTTGDTNTGIFFPAADTIAFSEGGSEAMRITNEGKLLVNQTTFPAGAVPSPYGAGTAGNGLGVLQIGSGGFTINHWTANAQSNGILFNKSRTAIPNTGTGTTENDDLGYLQFNADDGTNFVRAAQIFGEADAASSTGSQAGRLVFSTTTSGAGVPTERMRIDSSGNVGIGTTAPAVKLAVNSTDAILIPKGTTAQRPTGVTGYFRYNTDLSQAELYNGTTWGSVGGGGGATGGGSDEIFIENGQTVTTSYSIGASRNAMSTGPISVSGGVTVTIPTGSRWVIL